ncbi:MAG: CPBP family intramembrane metalloprotease, partial [Nocardia sp.]|nr:CPBP family intramembrane metalloprotease [Nocardia sp.]
MSASANPAATGRTPRRLSYALFALVVITYLVIIQAGGLILHKISGEEDMFTTRAVFFGMIIPLGVALVFTYAVAA